MRDGEKKSNIIANVTVGVIELTTAVVRVTEPELQTGGCRTLLGAIRRTDKQPKILLYMI